jgi:hypothetical protein
MVRRPVRRLVLILGTMAITSCSSSGPSGIGELDVASPSPRVSVSPEITAPPSPAATSVPGQGAVDQLARAAMALLQSNDAGAANSTLNNAADRSGCELRWQPGWLRSMKGAALVEAIAEKYLELGADVVSFVIERPSAILADAYPWGEMPGSARYAFVLGIWC